MDAQPEPRPEQDRHIDLMTGVLRDGRRVPIRVQHSLLTGVLSGSL